MKRLMSMMLALLLLVGMALAEETPDAALGDWYALNTENEAICLTLREDGTFHYVMDGTWRKTEDGEYLLSYNNSAPSLLELLDGIGDWKAPEADMTARLTETGLDVSYYGSPDGMVIHMVRDAEALRTARTPLTDTPLEAFAGTWTVETLFGGVMQMTYTSDMDKPDAFCTIDGLTMFPGAGLGSFPEGKTYALTLEDGVLHTTIPVPLKDDETRDYELSFFRTTDGSLYATLRLNDVPDNPETMFLLVPMEKE
ncbi:MAG: hypothetical protein ACLT1X_03585 [Christensenellales bacterium]